MSFVKFFLKTLNYINLWISKKSVLHANLMFFIQQLLVPYVTQNGPSPWTFSFLCDKSLRNMLRLRYLRHGPNYGLVMVKILSYFHNKGTIPGWLKSSLFRYLRHNYGLEIIQINCLIFTMKELYQAGWKAVYYGLVQEGLRLANQSTSISLMVWPSSIDSPLTMVLSNTTAGQLDAMVMMIS